MCRFIFSISYPVKTGSGIYREGKIVDPSAVYNNYFRFARTQSHNSTGMAAT